MPVSARQTDTSNGTGSGSGARAVGDTKVASLVAQAAPEVALLSQLLDVQ